MKGRCTKDLPGSLLLTTVSQNGPKISPRGVEMPQLNGMLLIPGTGNGERGTGNGERGTGNGSLGTNVQRQPA